MKTLYLMVNGYSKTFLKELVILFQVIILGFCASYSLCYVFEATAAERYARRTFDRDAAYFAFGERFQDRAFSESLTYGRLEDSPLFSEVFHELERLPELEGIGRGSSVFFSIDRRLMEEYAEQQQLSERSGIIQINCSMYNRSLIELAPLAVSKGRWFTGNETDSVDAESGVIPIVAGGALRNHLSVGEEIPAVLNVNSVERIETFDDGGGTTTRASFSTEHIPVRLRVIGILARDSMPYRLSYGGTFQTMENAFGKQNDMYGDLISPVITYGEKSLIEEFASIECNMLLFTKDINTVLTEWNERLNSYGSVNSIEGLVENEVRLFKGGGNVYSLYTVFSVLLIFVGVGGYNITFFKRRQKRLGIYFVCGMTRCRAAAVALLGNAVIFAAGSAAGILTGLAAAQELRSFMRDSLLMSAGATLAIIAAIYAVTSIAILAVMANMQPCELIREGTELTKTGYCD